MAQKSNRRAYVCEYFASTWKGVGDADDMDQTQAGGMGIERSYMIVDRLESEF